LYQLDATPGNRWRFGAAFADSHIGGAVDAGEHGGHNGLILVVEDAETIRKMVCAMLTQWGYRCLDACDGAEALRLVESAPDAIDLVLTDVLMPKMGGAELARRLANIRPDLRILFMSGYTEDPIVRTIERSRSMFLEKPFTAAALMDKVREILEGPWAGLPQVNTGAGSR
jgi:two-component system, cell cycle sensor histidine kinase and response regulator CckA